MRKFFLILGVLLSSMGAYSQVKFLKSFYLDQASDPTVSNSGKFLYLSSHSSIEVYSINTQNGELTKRSTFKNSSSEELGYVSLSPDDRFLYTRTHVRKNGSTITTFLTLSCDPMSGKLSLISSLDNQNNTTFDFNASQHFSPNGNLMFIADNHGDDLYVYRRNANGSFTHLNSIHGQSSAFDDLTFSPDGKFIYTTGANIFQEAKVFRIDEHSGQVTKVQDVINNLYPQEYAKEILISPDGKNAYTVHTDIDPYSDYQPSDIFQYSRDPQSGVLTLQKHYPNLKNDGVIEITKMYMDGSGNYLYALLSFGGEKHAIHVFKRDRYSGDLVKQQSFFDSYPTNNLKGIYQMDFTNDNRFIYATSARDYHVNIFENTKAAGSVVIKPEVTEMGVTDDGFEWEETDQPGTGTYTYDNSIPVNEMNYERPVETVVNHETGLNLGEAQFNEIWEKLKNEPSDTKRFDLCYQLLEGKSLKTVQIASVAMLFSSEYKRLEFVKFASYFVRDKENFKLLGDLFTYDSIKQDFYKLPM